MKVDQLRKPFLEFTSLALPIYLMGNHQQVLKVLPLSFLPPRFLLPSVLLLSCLSLSYPPLSGGMPSLSSALAQAWSLSNGAISARQSWPAPAIYWFRKSGSEVQHSII